MQEQVSQGNPWMLYMLFCVLLIVWHTYSASLVNDQVKILRRADEDGELTYADEMKLAVPNNRFFRAVADSRIATTVALATAPVLVVVWGAQLVFHLFFFILPVEIKNGITEMAYTVSSARRR